MEKKISQQNLETRWIALLHKWNKLLYNQGRQRAPLFQQQLGDFSLPLSDRWWSNGNADGSLHQSSALMPKHKLSDGGPQSILHSALWWPRHPPKCQSLLQSFWCRQDLDEFLVVRFCLSLTVSACCLPKCNKPDWTEKKLFTVSFSHSGWLFGKVCKSSCAFAEGHFWAAFLKKTPSCYPHSCDTDWKTPKTWTHYLNSANPAATATTRIILVVLGLHRVRGLKKCSENTAQHVCCTIVINWSFCIDN